MSTFELQPEHQHMPGEEAEIRDKKTYKVHFGQIYLSKPMVTEADGMTSTLFPKEARLRNLTYSAGARVSHSTPPLSLCLRVLALDSHSCEASQRRFIHTLLFHVRSNIGGAG